MLSITENTQVETKHIILVSIFSCWCDLNDNDYVDDDDDDDDDDDVDDVDDVVDAKSDSPVSAAGSSLTSAKTGTQPIF